MLRMFALIFVFFIGSAWHSALGQIFFSRTFSAGDRNSEARAFIDSESEQLLILGNGSQGDNFSPCLYWAERNGERIETACFPGQHSALFFSGFRSPDRRNFAVLAGEEYSLGIRTQGLIYVVNTDTRRIARRIELPPRQAGGSIAIKGIAPAPDGGFYIAGNEVLQGNISMFAARLTSTGDTIWFRRLEGARADYVQGFTLTAEGDLIIVGDSQSFAEEDSFNFDIITYKLTPAGDVLWQRVLGEPSRSNGAQRVKQISDGRIIIVGESTFEGRRGFDITVGIIAPDNSNADIKYISAEPSEAAFDLIELTAGEGFALTGYTSPRDGAQSIFLLRTDSNFEPLLQTAFEFGSLSVGYSLALTPNATLYCIGKTATPMGEESVLLHVPVSTLTSIIEQKKSELADVKLIPSHVNSGTPFRLVGQPNATFKYTIFSSLGVPVQDGKTLSGQPLFLSGHLASGLYFVNINQGEAILPFIFSR